MTVLDPMHLFELFDDMVAWLNDGGDPGIEPDTALTAWLEESGTPRILIDYAARTGDESMQTKIFEAFGFWSEPHASLSPVSYTHLTLPTICSV